MEEREVPKTEPKFAAKSVEAIGETREVMLLNVLFNVGMGFGVR